MGATQQDPTQAAFSDAAQVPDVPKSGKEKAFGLIGALTTGVPKGGALDTAIEKHHQARLDEAKMHRRNASTAAGILTYGIDPATGQPLTEEQKQQYQNEYQAAMGHYEKIAGVNKETKGAIQKARMLVEHMIGQGQKKQAGQATPGAPPPPPPAPAATATAGPTAPPLPGGGTPQQGVPFADKAPFLRDQVSSERDFADYKRRQELLRDFKIDEETAKAKAIAQAKTQNPGTPPRPVFSRPISVLDSRTLASQGTVFENQDGEPIDTSSIPDSMSLQPFVTRVTETDDQNNSRQVWKTRYIPISPNQKTFTVGNETYAVNPADASKQGAPAPLGEHTVPTTRRTTDPATRQTTVSTTTPKTSGMTGAVPPPPTVPNAATPTAPARRTGTGTAHKPTGAGTNAVAPLDAEGHIPMTEGSPQVVEGANQLLDGMDIKSLPAKTKELSGSLARRYGWEQGRFTPKEQVMLKESSTFLKEALDNDSMKVLDSTASKLKLGQVLAAGGHQGMVGRTLSTVAASSMNPKEAEFVRMYNQLVGTVSGLSQLVRSGRATEAQIERLKAELPSVLTAKDSADGKKRIERLLKEIDVAMEKGTFGAGASKSAPPAPPSGQGLSPAARKYLESQGVKVP